MRIGIVAAVVLWLAGVVHASATDDDKYQCPKVQLSAASGPSVVVAETLLGLTPTNPKNPQQRYSIALRYELASADRVCTRRNGGLEERLRSFQVRGTSPVASPARNRGLLKGDKTFTDVDTSTAISVLLPEDTPGLGAYACFRFLSSSPTARLCFPADVDGTGIQDVRPLLCNRGRCQLHAVGFISNTADLYQGVLDAVVTLPGVSTPVAAVAVMTRTAVGFLDLNVALDPLDALTLRVKLRSKRRWHFEGERQTAADPAVAVQGDGHGRLTAVKNPRIPGIPLSKHLELAVTAELTSVQGTITLTMERSSNDPFEGFKDCYLLAVHDPTEGDTTIRLPIVVSVNGIGASRPTVQLAADGTVVRMLDAGACGVTTSGRLACTIPSGATDVRLFGLLSGATGDHTGEGELAVGATGPVATWTAETCPPEQ